MSPQTMGNILFVSGMGNKGRRRRWGCIGGEVNVQ